MRRRLLCVCQSGGDSYLRESPLNSCRPHESPLTWRAFVQQIVSVWTGRRERKAKVGRIPPAQWRMRISSADAVVMNRLPSCKRNPTAPRTAGRCGRGAGRGASVVPRSTPFCSSSSPGEPGRPASPRTGGRRWPRRRWRRGGRMDGLSVEADVNRRVICEAGGKWVDALLYSRPV